jgi:hypothetical protein
LWAMTLRVAQAALAPKRPEGKWLRPTPYFKGSTRLNGESSFGFSAASVVTAR